MANPMHVNDYGAIINITVKDQSNNPVDLSSVTSHNIYFRKPDKTVVTTSGVVSDATNGIITYTVPSGQLDLVGIFSIQARVITPSGQFSSNISEFRVDPNII